MPELILILFKINFVLLLFAAAYYLILRRLTFYTLNRAFLVIGIVFSTVYPFIDLTEFFNRQEQLNPSVIALVPNIDVDSIIRENAILNYWQILTVLFYLGVILMAIRLIAQFISLYRVHQRSKPGSVRDLNVRILAEKVSPFSFWQTVYINPSIHSAQELDTILAHEQVHVKDWHTLDIILAEISVVFYWFNPGVWLMKRAIKENIEFITDSKIVKRGIDKKEYQYSLLGVGNLQSNIALVNHFNISDLKKRIKMMNAKRSSPKKLAIYALILPVLLITTLAFTVTKKEVKKHLLPLTNAIEQVTKLNTKIPETVIDNTKYKLKRKINLLKSTFVKADSTEKLHYIVRTIKLTSDSLSSHLAIPETINLIASEHLDEAIKGVTKGIKISANAFFYTKSDTIPKKTTFKRVENISITLRKPEDPALTEVVVMGSKMNKANLSDSVKTVIGKPMFILNGKPISQDELLKMKAEDIKTVVIKADQKVSGVLIGTKIQ